LELNGAGRAIGGKDIRDADGAWLGAFQIERGDEEVAEVLILLGFSPNCIGIDGLQLLTDFFKPFCEGRAKGAFPCFSAGVTERVEGVGGQPFKDGSELLRFIQRGAENAELWSAFTASACLDKRVQQLIEKLTDVAVQRRGRVVALYSSKEFPLQFLVESRQNGYGFFNVAAVLPKEVGNGEG